MLEIYYHANFRAKDNLGRAAEYCAPFHSRLFSALYFRYARGKFKISAALQLTGRWVCGLNTNARRGEFRETASWVWFTRFDSFYNDNTVKPFAKLM